MKSTSFHPRTHPSFPKSNIERQHNTWLIPPFPSFLWLLRRCGGTLNNKKKILFFLSFGLRSKTLFLLLLLCQRSGTEKQQRAKEEKNLHFSHSPPLSPFLTSSPSPLLAIPVICLLRPVPNFPLPGFSFFFFFFPKVKRSNEPRSLVFKGNCGEGGAEEFSPSSLLLHGNKLKIRHRYSWPAEPAQKMQKKYMRLPTWKFLVSSQAKKYGKFRLIPYFRPAETDDF